MGTPIRLVRNDGGIIELMGTTLTMNVDRGVTPLPMPFAGGSRFAFDLNLPKALITIEGVMTDDDFTFQTPTNEASATIDFSAVSGGGRNSAVRWTTEAITDVIANVPSADDAGVADADHAITINANATHKVYLTKHSSSNHGFTGGRYFIAVHNGTSARSAADIAGSLTTLVNTYTGTLNMSATNINSPVLGTTNTAVTLTQTGGQGKNGNTSHPSFDTWTSQTFKPYHIQFSGGRSTATGKGAGDKVAELFAVLNNSNNGGGGAVFNPDAWVRVGVGLVNENQSLDAKYGDYIIGIQIPFSSVVNDRESLFYMPTGPLMETTDKTADNAPVTGTKFSPYNSEFTGIKGTVANATFVQLGGEPIYSYTINFAPIDWIF